MQFLGTLFSRIKVAIVSLSLEVIRLPYDLLLLGMLIQVNQFRKQSWLASEYHLHFRLYHLFSLNTALLDQQDLGILNVHQMLMIVICYRLNSCLMLLPKLGQDHHQVRSMAIQQSLMFSRLQRIIMLLVMLLVALHQSIIWLMVQHALKSRHETLILAI